MVDDDELTHSGHYRVPPTPTPPGSPLDSPLMAPAPALPPPAHYISSLRASSRRSPGGVSPDKERDPLARLLRFLRAFYRELAPPWAPPLPPGTLCPAHFQPSLQLAALGTGGRADTESRDTIRLDQILSAVRTSEGVMHDAPRRVVVEGGPGSGKTTLALRLLHSWATQDDWLGPSIQLALFVPLRELKGSSLAHYLSKELLPKTALGGGASPWSSGGTGTCGGGNGFAQVNHPAAAFMFLPRHASDVSILELKKPTITAWGPHYHGDYSKAVDLSVLTSIDLSVLPSIELTALPSVDLSVLTTIDLSVLPSIDLTVLPSVDLTVLTSVDLTVLPSVDLSVLTTIDLSVLPSVDLTVLPSVDLSVLTTIDLSVLPSVDLTVLPSVHLSVLTTIDLSVLPSVDLTVLPSVDLTVLTSVDLTVLTTIDLTVLPSVDLTVFPSVDLTVLPSVDLSVLTTIDLSVLPSADLTVLPSVDLSVLPSIDLTVLPSVDLTVLTSVDLTVLTSVDLSVLPSIDLTVLPSVDLTVLPSVDLSVLTTIDLSVLPDVWKCLGHLEDRLLFVLDGYDEAVSLWCQEGGGKGGQTGTSGGGREALGDAVELLEGRLFPECRILVTCCPGWSSELIPLVQRRVLLHGLDWPHVERLVTAYFAGNKKPECANSSSAEGHMVNDADWLDLVT
uniref:NACHT domain-containing protein n=1 Tax=Timema douglasi TaxID=61478 RepID=A0A7R8VNH8_TIMDO|nr:unnamed protein product [Timema douglasi]